MLKAAVDSTEQRLTSWLRPETEYVVLAVEEYSGGTTGYRISGEDGGPPVLFQAALFAICDSRLPKSWSILGLQGATLELGPPEFARVGFWEEVFDHEPSALEMYASAKRRILEDS